MDDSAKDISALHVSSRRYYTRDWALLTDALMGTSLAIRLWSSVHGFTTLMLENQFPPQYLQEKEIKEQFKGVMLYVLRINYYLFPHKYW